MKLLKSFLIVLVALFATTNIAYSQTASTDQTTDNLKTLSVKVKGVGCATDCKTICSNVEKLDGVSSFTTVKKGATTTFEAKYDPSLVTEEQINAAVENTGGCTNPDSRPYKVKL